MDSSDLFAYSAETQSQIPGFLGHLYEDEVARLLTYLQERRYGRGEYAIHAGARDRSLYIVTGGSFESVAPGRRGPQRLMVYQTGDIFGELAFFDGLPRSADVRALQEAEALIMTPDGFKHLRLSEPRLAMEFVLDLGRVLSMRFRDYNRRAGELGLH
jgi:CRP-like cAMP-binding protein